MKHTTLNFMVWSLGLCAIGCSSPGDDRLDDAAVAEIETAVSGRMNELMASAEAGDIESVFTFYDQSGPGSYLDQAYRFDSFQDFVETYRTSWNVSEEDFGDPDVRIFVLNANAALVSSTSNVSHVDTLGTAYPPTPWAITMLWTRDDGPWHIHSFHQASQPREP